MPRSLTEVSTPDLVSKYAALARIHQAYADADDTKRLNAASREIVRVYKELRGRGEPELLMLEPLLDEGLASVRLWVSIHLLSLVPDKAEAVLAELSRPERSWHSQVARGVLESWRAGMPVPAY